ncbi:MAG: hypothetical protein ACK5EV_07830, partial [Burkholderiales bacterium]
ASRPATWCAKLVQAPTHLKRHSHHWLRKAFWCATAAADQPGMRCRDIEREEPKTQVKRALEELIERGAVRFEGNNRWRRYWVIS